MKAPLFLLACAALLFCAPVAHAEDMLPGRVISVSGEADVKRAPDKVAVSVTIQEQRKELKDAQKVTDEQLKSLYRIADQMGVTKGDLHTDFSSVQPVYEYTTEAKRVFAGYSVTHRVTVTLRDVEKLAELIRKLTEARIEQINGIQFGLQNEDGARNEALKRALEKAKAKAEMLASSLGEKLDKIYQVSENGVSFQPMPMLRTGKVMAMSGGIGMAMSAPADVAPPEGEISVRATVQATFLLKE